MLPVFTLYLLAQFPGKRAFTDVVNMFSALGEPAYRLVDTVKASLC